MQQNCQIATCRNFGRYWRTCGHGGEHIKPAATIKKVSNSLKDELRKYTKIAKAYLALNTKCAVCGGKSECIHHKGGRIGILLTMVKYFLAVCFACHRRIEENPQWAKENGYSVDRLTIPEADLIEQETIKVQS